MRARDILALVVVTLGGCQPTLLEERNDLRADVVELKDQLQASEDHVHELERELDTCQQEVGRKAVRSVLAEAQAGQPRGRDRQCSADGPR